MNLSNDNTLAIVVCTKRLGLAVFCRTELLYFAVKTLKPPRTDRHVKRQVSQIYQKTTTEFAPKVITLKLLGKQQAKSKNLQFVMRIIKHQSETAGISLEEISFDEAKRKLVSGNKPTKTNAFLALSKIFPELRRLTKFQNPAQAEYYNSLLSAVAVGFYFQSGTAKSSNKTQHEIKL